MTTTIRQYWDSRAATNRNSPAATTNDIHLRTLEARTLTAAIGRLSLPPGSRALDIGCGDGETTIRIAQTIAHLDCIGVDYAPAMIENAHATLKRMPSLSNRVRFAVGDVTALSQTANAQSVDVALSCRCLINLADADSQHVAMSQIARVIKPGGTYFAIENFMEGQDAMNRQRAAIGLPEIPVRWHNRFFTEDSLREAIAKYFTIERIEDFAGAYYYATRIVYSKLCQMRGEEPDYDHEIHRMAVDLPPIGCFSPVRMAVLRRK